MKSLKAKMKPQDWDNEVEYRLAVQKLWPDLLLKVEERIFSTHRHLLIHNCLYFKEYFASVYEKYPDQRKSIITITLEDFSSSKFAIVLNWMYTEILEFSNMNVAEVFLISKYLGIPPLLAKSYDFAKNYLQSYEDFYQMCCHLSPLAPEQFYSLLEMGYLSPFPDQSYVQNVKDTILGQPNYEKPKIELQYSKEENKFIVKFDCKKASEEMKYPPLNAMPIPLETLNILLLGKSNAKPAMKFQYLNKSGKYIAVPEGELKRERKKMMEMGGKGSKNKAKKLQGKDKQSKSGGKKTEPMPPTLPAKLLVPTMKKSSTSETSTKSCKTSPKDGSSITAKARPLRSTVSLAPPNLKAEGSKSAPPPPPPPQPAKQPSKVQILETRSSISSTLQSMPPKEKKLEPKKATSSTTTNKPPPPPLATKQPSIEQKLEAKTSASSTLQSMPPKVKSSESKNVNSLKYMFPPPSATQSNQKPKASSSSTLQSMARKEMKVESESFSSKHETSSLSSVPSQRPMEPMALKPAAASPRSGPAPPSLFVAPSISQQELSITTMAPTYIAASSGAPGGAIHVSARIIARVTSRKSIVQGTEVVLQNEKKDGRKI